jgi:hypothetical protein
MFVQIIEGRTKDGKALTERIASWHRDVGQGAVGFLGVTAGATADGRAIAVVRFESEEAARTNSDRPEQGAWFEETAKLYDGEPTFTESSDITLWMGGGSNDAGFVQVMKSTGVDRATVEKLDALFESHTGLRPDLLGGIRVWTGKDSCVDVAYFTSEAEAREGEKAEMPAELREAMAGMEAGMGTVEYFDLTEPHLR